MPKQYVQTKLQILAFYLCGVWVGPSLSRLSYEVFRTAIFWRAKFGLISADITPILFWVMWSALPILALDVLWGDAVILL
jgi:hypothetical protein